MIQYTLLLFVLFSVFSKTTAVREREVDCTVAGLFGCDEDSQCCEDTVCIRGVCEYITPQPRQMSQYRPTAWYMSNAQRKRQVACNSHNEPCILDEHCCSPLKRGGGHRCRSTAKCRSGGEKCKNNDQCCSKVCESNSRCQSGGVQPCREVLSTCNIKEDCCTKVCGYDYCLPNIFPGPQKIPSKGFKGNTCKSNGHECYAYNQCCSNICGSGYCMSKINEPPYPIPLINSKNFEGQQFQEPCKENGKECVLYTQCCSNICGSGYCKPNIHQHRHPNPLLKPKNQEDTIPKHPARKMEISAMIIISAAPQCADQIRVVNRVPSNHLSPQNLIQLNDANYFSISVMQIMSAAPKSASLVSAYLSFSKVYTLNHTSIPTDPEKLSPINPAREMEMSAMKIISAALLTSVGTAIAAYLLFSTHDHIDLCLTWMTWIVPSLQRNCARRMDSSAMKIIGVAFLTPVGTVIAAYLLFSSHINLSLTWMTCIVPSLQRNCARRMDSSAKKTGIAARISYATITTISNANITENIPMKKRL